jgi:endonuclease III
MRGATDCARRLKLLFSSLRSKLGKVARPPATDPITQMILGVLSRDTPEARAAEGLGRLRTMVVDYNELRVIPPIELADLLSDFADARLKCEDISRALNRVFALEHTLSLERLTRLPRKDVLAYLERIDGLEPYTRARVLLLGLRQHAVPLDEAMWALARRERIVDGRCPLDEAQRFLERQIAEEDALEFFALFRKHAWNEMGPAVRKRAVARIISVPPDRTSRNMLQMVAASAAAIGGDDLVADVAESDLAEPDPAGEAAKARAVALAPAGDLAPSARRHALRTASKSAARATGSDARRGRGVGEGAPARARTRAARPAARVAPGHGKSGKLRTGRPTRRGGARPRRI